MKLLLPSALAAILLTTSVISLPAAAETTTDFQSMRAKLTIYGTTYNGQTFFGQVLNKTRKTMYGLMVYYRILDERGQVVAAGRVPLLENQLGGQKNGTFGGKTETVGKTFEVTSVEWIDPSKNSDK